MGSDVTDKTPEGAGKQVETEIKLVGEPAALSALFDRHPGTAQTSRTVSRYFDTGDMRIWRRGYALRLRQVGGSSKLTLKASEADIGRGEWTVAVAGDVVDLGLLPPDAPMHDIGTILPEELSEIFRSDVERSTKLVDIGRTTVELALDRGRIFGNGNEAAVSELEFELVAGEPAPMLRHVRSLLPEAAAAVSVHSKAARGIEVATGCPPVPAKAGKPALKPTDTLESCVREALAVTASQILGNLAAAADGRDPEGVHQLRVALRRLRSMWILFGNRLNGRAQALPDETRRILQAFGPARDLDVFLGETVAALRDSLDDPGLSALVEKAQRARERAYADVRRTIAGTGFNRFLLDLLILRYDRTPIVSEGHLGIVPVAVKKLRQRHRDAIKAGRGFADLAGSERHRVRIAIKKLRYACDYFQTLFPAEASRPYLKHLSRFQDDLGVFNDAFTAGSLATELAGGEQEASIGAALVRGWYEHRLKATEPHMLRAWQRFADTRPFWETEGA